MESQAKQSFSLIKYAIVVLLAAVLSPAKAQYLLFNSTTDLGNSTFQITPDSLNTYGSVWYKLAQDAKKDFEVSGQYFFGNREDGADGIVFVIQNNCVNAGTFGGGIGYGGMPGLTLGVEFDTYQNDGLSGNQDNLDPVNDHIAILKNGNVKHSSVDSNLAGPVQMHTTKTNVEDGIWYDFRITWNATTHLMEVYFDGDLRLTYTVDIINDIFAGDDVFYWGFTSATGGSSAANTVKINPPPLYGIPDPAICIGDTAQIQLPILNNLSVVSEARPISASAAAQFPAFEANDGNIATRWASAAVDNQHLTIDLLDFYEISRAEIQWETAAGLAYDIQISDDSTVWTTVASVTDGVNGEFRTINFPAVKTRFVRMQGYTRTTGFGFSIWEFKVYGVGEYVWTPATFISDVNSSMPKLYPPVTTVYKVKVPDNCNGPSIIDMTVFVDDIQLSLGPDFTICETDTLKITPQVTGAFGVTTFEWSPVVSTDSIFKLHPPVAGTYQAIVTDTLNCKDTSTVTVSLDTSPTVANAGLNDTICVSKGTHVLSANTPLIGTGAWNLLVGTGNLSSNSAPNSILSAFGVDTLSLEWSIANGVCPTSRDTLEIVIHPTPIAGTLTGGTICPGDSLLLNLAGIVGDSIVWESSTDNVTFNPFGGNDTSMFVKPIVQTSYRATVKFSNGACTSVQSNTVTINISPVVTKGTFTATDLSYCSGGSANLTLNGAVGTITWQESTDNVTFTNYTGAAVNTTSSTISATTTGVTDTLYYRTRITSTCDTAYSDTARIVIHPTPTAGTLTGGTICPGYSLLLNLAGIVGDSIVWESSTDNVTFNPFGGNDTSLFVKPIVQTSYRASVKFTNGDCAAVPSNTVQINVSATVTNGTFTATDLSYCSGSSASLTLNGAVGTITWQESTDNITFTNYSGAVVNATSTTISATTSGVTDTLYYRTRITSTCDTAYSDTARIIIHPTPTAGTLTGGTICPGDSLLLNLAGIVGDSIVWSSSTDNVTFIPFGGNDTSLFVKPIVQTSYRATVKFSNGACTSVQSNTVTINISPVVTKGTFTATDLSYCSGSSASLTLNGAVGTITWQESTDNITFTNYSGAVVNATSTTISATTSGVTDTLYYRTRITSTCDTAYSDTARIIIHPTPTAGTLTGGTICPGDSLLLSLAGIVGDSIVWSSSTDNVTFNPFGGNDTSLYVKPIVQTSYRATVKFSNGACTSVQSNTVTINISPVVTNGTFTTTDLSYCSGSSASLTLNGAVGTITWQESTDNVTFTNYSGAAVNATSTSISATTTGVTDTLYYRTRITSTCDTAYSDTVRVVIHPEPLAGNLIGAGALCVGDLATVFLESGIYNQLRWEKSLNGGASWNTVAGAITDTLKENVTANASYRLIATTSALCPTDTTDPIAITTTTIPPTPQISLSQQEICSNELVDLKVIQNGTVPQTWQKSIDGGNWSTIPLTTLSFTEALSNSNINAQSVRYRAVNALTCGTAYSDSLQVVVYPNPSGSIESKSVCEDITTEVAFVKAGPWTVSEWQTSSDSINWKFQNSDQKLVFTIEKDTYVRAIYTNGLSYSCADTSNKLLFNKCDFEAPPITIPNALTPNGDGANETFVIINIEFYPKSILKIFNRWGSLVYEKEGYLNDWGGTHNGKLLPTGTYYYVLNLNNGSKDFKGYVMILE